MELEHVLLKENGQYACGGLSHSKETLGEFLADLNPLEKRTLEDVNMALNACGILPINKFNYPDIEDAAEKFDELDIK